MSSLTKSETRWTCDRCGAVETLAQRGGPIGWSNRSLPAADDDSWPVDVDLCDGCEASLREWFFAGRKVPA